MSVAELEITHFEYLFPAMEMCYYELLHNSKALNIKYEHMVF